MRGRMMRASVPRGTSLGVSCSSSSSGGHRQARRARRERRQRAAVHGLQPLGVLDAGREAAGDVGGDVLAADGDGIDVDELAAIEDGDGGGAAAEIDDGAAEFGLVVDEHRQAAGIGRGDHRLDGEMAAVEAELDVAELRLVGGDDVHVDAERGRRPCRAGRRCRPRRRGGSRWAANGRRRGRRWCAWRRPAASTRPMSLSAIGVTGRGRRRRRQVSLARRPAETRDDQRFDGDAGHALGGIDGVADGLLGRVEVGDDAGLDAVASAAARSPEPRWRGCGRETPRRARPASGGATRQQILVEPMSRTETMVGRCARPLPLMEPNRRIRCSSPRASPCRVP